jgi:hypothetical protein
VAKLNERQRLWITIGASLLLTGGAVTLVVLDRSEIKATETEIEALESRINAADGEIRKTKDREDAVIILREVEQRELEILPQKQQIADFLANLTTFLTQAGAQFVKLPESAPKESELARGVYLTPTTINFEADAAALLRFVNMIEIDPRLVAVKGFKVKSGGRSKEGKQPLHKCEIQLETYYYDPASSGRKSVPIPNYESRLEDPVVRQAITSFQPERRDTYTLRPAASRRDPFVDFRREVVHEDPETVKRRFEQEENVVVDLEKRLDEVREKAELERAVLASGDIFKADRIAHDVDTLVNEIRVRIANVASVKSVTFPDLVARGTSVKRRIDEIAAGRKDLPRELTVTSGVAQSTRDAMQLAFQRGDYAEVSTLSTAWEQFIRGKAVEEAAKPYLDEIKSFRARSRTLADFHAKVIHVTGTIVSSDGPGKGFAIVNGRTLKVGEFLDDRGEVQVLGVDRDGVLFGYQGERIKIRREDSSGAGGRKGGAPGGANSSVPLSVDPNVAPK